MAGEWIKVRTNLWEDPRVAGLAEKTKTSEATVIGALYWLWATADEHSEDGLLPSISLTTVDRKTGVKGIGAALKEIGWVDVTEKGVQIIRFDEHNGESAKTRAQTAKRVSKHKANAKVTLPPLPEDYPDVTDALPRIRIREDKSKHIPPIPPKGGESEESTKKPTIALATYLQACKDDHLQPIPNDDPVFEYAEQVELPTDFLALQWEEFKTRYRQAGSKRYKDWKKVFRNSVRGNWFKLWYLDGNGKYALTTVGIQAQRAHRGAA